MAVTARSHAKINLGLAIGAPRPDGFHSLVTAYQTLAAHDRVTVSAIPAEKTTIHLTSNEAGVPTDARNTAWKMVERALLALDLTARITIHIEKRLPVQGGLGAGSGNAVAALLALEAELAIPDSAAWRAERLRLAAAVGSDVPLFLIGGTVLGLDRGQQVFPLPDQPTLCCLVATPAVGVSTPQAFRDWDALWDDRELTAEASDDTLDQLSRVYAGACSQAHFPREMHAAADSSGVLPAGPDLAGPLVSALVRTGIGNDFERVVFAQHPFLSEIKRLLAAVGTPEESLYASLSGSGSSLFGLYRGQEQAEAVRLRLRALGVDAFLTHTLPRAAYWPEMLLPSSG
jgi:4-diphosphocytidyl-2-C-methyl-D-erythritol kinase